MRSIHEHLEKTNMHAVALKFKAVKFKPAKVTGNVFEYLPPAHALGALLRFGPGSAGIVLMAIASSEQRSEASAVA